MRVRTMKELGAAIRSRRKTLGLDQAMLAAQAGVSREWIIDIEKGKPRAEAGLVLRTLSALDLLVTISEPSQTSKPYPELQSKTGRQSVDIDRIVARAREIK